MPNPSAEYVWNAGDISVVQFGEDSDSIVACTKPILTDGNILKFIHWPLINLHPSKIEVDSPILIAAYDHWLSGSPEWRPPPITHIDPCALRCSLGWIALWDSIGGGDDFECRLFGSELVWRFNIDLTGARMSSIPAAIGSFLIATHKACVARRGPLLVHFALSDPATALVCCLLLPWANEAGDVARVMAAVALQESTIPNHVPPHSDLIRFRS